MALMHSTASVLGSPAPDFSLRGVDGRTHSLSDFRDAKALTVVFMCNHCPYVIAVQERLNALAREFLPRGHRLVGINSNNAEKYPADSFEAMQVRAKEQGFVFPYLVDEDQSVARAYDAVCTPDIYLYRNDAGVFRLAYRGRLDDSWKDPAAVKRRDLAEAIEAVLAGRDPNPDQISSMGCSIKWK